MYIPERQAFIINCSRTAGLATLFDGHTISNKTIEFKVYFARVPQQRQTTTAPMIPILGATVIEVLAYSCALACAWVCSWLCALSRENGQWDPAMPNDAAVIRIYTYRYCSDSCRAVLRRQYLTRRVNCGPPMYTIRQASRQ